jgi:hypothetical protein
VNQAARRVRAFLLDYSNIKGRLKLFAGDGGQINNCLCFSVAMI